MVAPGLGGWPGDAGAPEALGETAFVGGPPMLLGAIDVARLVGRPGRRWASDDATPRSEDPPTSPRRGAVAQCVQSSSDIEVLAIVTMDSKARIPFGPAGARWGPDTRVRLSLRGGALFVSEACVDDKAAVLIDGRGRLAVRPGWRYRSQLQPGMRVVIVSWGPGLAIVAPGRAGAAMASLLGGDQR